MEYSLTFKTVWLTLSAPGFSLRKILAYDDIGILIITNESVSFRGKNTQVVFSDISQIIYGCHGSDRVNYWVQVEFGGGRNAYLSGKKFFQLPGHYGETKQIFNSLRPHVV